MSEHIKREDAIGAILDKYVDYAGITDAIKDVPSADVVEVKHGRWENGDGSKATCLYDVYCSVCGEVSEYSTDYCPNCGAKMDGERRK